MTDGGSQTTLLRVAAFLVDTLSMAIVLILPASIISYVVAWLAFGRAVSLVWFVALGLFAIGLIIRDGYRGRSIGKRILGLRILTPRGEGCGYGRSLVRNLPLVIPVWNVIEAVFVLLGKPRTGDRIARTTVTEE
jgi:uncharacterized RDD family membrane protein YckC